MNSFPGMDGSSPATPYMRVSLVGECMITRPFGVHDESPFVGLFDHLRLADFTYAHLETNFGHYHEIETASKSGKKGTFFLTDPVVAGELRQGGIRAVSLAQNHSGDYGTPALLSTIRYCEQAGLAHAGTGRDLEEAREPAYIETRRGRVALVSAAAGNPSNEWATLPKAGMAGRPGVNPVRVMMKTVVDAAAASELQRIGKELKIFQTRDNVEKGAGGRALTDLAPGDFGLQFPETTQSNLGPTIFKPGDKFSIESNLHPGDLAANVRAVQEACTMSDLVLVAFHFSVGDGPRGDTPPKFAREFAHACIDAGADIFIGHGWHRTLGIEIYKDKPIIYGIGNFFHQSGLTRRSPYDAYEAWGHDIERLPQLNPGMAPLHGNVNTPSETQWSGAILDLDLDRDYNISALRLLPIELGRSVKGDQIRRKTGKTSRVFPDGRPFPAHGEDAQAILERYQRLSEELGTHIEIKNDVGLVCLPQDDES